MNRQQEGHALLEALLLGLLLLVPLMWLLMVSAELHRTALAASSAAREAGLAAARSPDLREASSSARSTARRLLAEQGIPAGSAEIALAWDEPLTRGALLEVMVSSPVEVFRAPLIGRVSGPAIWIRARHVARVDPYRSNP